MPDSLKEIGSRIEIERKRLKLSQETLATRASTTQKTISSIENGLQDTAASLLSAIAGSLDTTSSALLGEPDSSTLFKALLPVLAALDYDGLKSVLEFATSLAPHAIGDSEELSDRADNT